MILTVNIGNSYINIGCFEENRLLFQERISTNRYKTALEYTTDFLAVCYFHNVNPKDVTGGILACVIPELQGTVSKAIQRAFAFTPFIASPESQTLIPIAIDRPETLGTNLLVTAIAALSEYPLPLSVIEFGATTAIGILDQTGAYIGGAFYPGIYNAAEALLNNTFLSGMDLESEISPMGVNTKLSISGGIVLGHAGMVDELLYRFEEELGYSLNVIGTGKPASVIIPHCVHTITLDDSLLLKGLSILYRHMVSTNSSTKEADK